MKFSTQIKRSFYGKISRLTTFEKSIFECYFKSAQKTEADKIRTQLEFLFIAQKSPDRRVIEYSYTIPIVEREDLKLADRGENTSLATIHCKVSNVELALNIFTFDGILYEMNSSKSIEKKWFSLNCEECTCVLGDPEESHPLSEQRDQEEHGDYR